MAALPPDPHSSDPFRIGDWVIEPGLSRLSRDGEEHYLEPKLMAVLMCLASHADRIVSNDILIREVWNDRPMGDNPVYRCVAELRKAFGDDSHHPAYIVTVPKRGYRLIAPVTPAAPGARPESLRNSDSSSSSARRKRVPLSVLAAALSAVIASIVVAAYFSNTGPAAADDPYNLSLAVMPFSGNTDSQMVFTGGGIAQEISRQLAEAPGLRMISYNSTASLSNASTDIEGIADLLGADYVLTGRLSRQNGNSMEVQGRLLNARGEEVWSRVFTARAADTFGLVGEIARNVADNLNVPFDPAWVAACGGTRNIAACQKYKLASEHLRTRGAEFKARSLRLFEEAITLDPGFAAAYAGIARTYLLPGSEMPWPEAVAHAETAIQRALELNHALPEAYMVQAILLDTDRRGPCPPVCINLHGYEAAERAARRAVSLDPRSPDAHNILGFTFSGQGRLSEAAAHYNIALMYDPLNPVVNYNIALHKALQGDYPGARRYIQEFIDKHPNPPPFLYTVRALIEYYYGDYDKSLTSLQLLMDSPSSPVSDWLLTENYHHLGWFERIEEVLADREDAAYYDILQAATRRKTLVSQGRMDALDALAGTLAEDAAGEYGPPEEWPRWLHRVLGLSLFALERYDRGVFHLTQVHGADGVHVDHQFIVAELDSLHALGYMLKALGRGERGDAVIDHTLALLADRKSQGYDGLPELTVAEARAYAVQGKTALAMATLRRAVAQGWRGYRTVNSADPRWDSLSGEPDFEALLVRVREEVDQMRGRLEARLAGRL